MKILGVSGLSTFAKIDKKKHSFQLHIFLQNYFADWDFGG